MSDYKKLTPEQRTEIANTLVKWSMAKPEDIPEPLFGICFNLDSHFHQFDCRNSEDDSVCWSYRMVRNLSDGWEHHSGTPSYPVNGISNTSNSLDKAIPRWSGEEGKLRRDLCLYIANKLFEEVKEETEDQ